MITMSSALENLLSEYPILEDGLAAGIINLSALARQLRPRLQAVLKKEVSEGAVMMALKRLQPHIIEQFAEVRHILKNLVDITVRSNLSEFTYAVSEATLEKQKELLDRLGQKREAFVTFTQGVAETMVIVSSRFEHIVEEIFRHEKRLAKLSSLSAIIIKLPAKSVHTPGVFYAILKQMLWARINVVEMVSTYSEFTLVFEKDQVDRAFSQLKNFLWR